MILVGLSGFYICLALIFLYSSLFIEIKLSQNQIRILLGFLTLSFCILAYMTNPSVPDDLYRHYLLLENIRKRGLTWVFTYSMYRFELLTMFLFSLCAFIGNNHLLPTFTIMIMYILFWRTINNYVKKRNVFFSSVSLFILVHFSVVFLRWSISNIRYNLALMLFFIAVFYDLVNQEDRNRFICILLYLAPVLVHTSYILFLLIRILTTDLIYPIVVRFKWLIPIWSFSGYIAIKILSITGVPFLVGIANQINVYWSYGYSNYDLRLIIAKSILLIIITFMINIVKRYNQSKFFEMQKYYEFFEIVLLFMVGSVFVSTIYDRMSFLVVTLGLPVFCDFYKSVDKKTGNLFFIVTILITSFLFLYQFYDCSNNWFFNGI